MEKGDENSENGDNMFGGSRGDRFLQRISVRRRFTHIHQKKPKNWEETRLKQIKSHIMVSLKGRFKGETGDKWHMLLIVDIKYSGIEVRRWLYLDGGWSSFRQSWDHFPLASCGLDLTL